MPLPNPFKKAAEVEVYIKALLYGPTGAGKTWYALGCPGPVAVFDTEGGSTLFASIFDFDRVGSKSYRELIGAIEFMEANPGIYKTFVIDPITVIYEVLQEAALRARIAKRSKQGGAGFDPDSVDLERLDWGKIKRNYKALMNRLMNLPANVIVCARQKDDATYNAAGESTKVGFKPDAEKSTEYYFDVVLHGVSPAGSETHKFVVEKARGIIGKYLPAGTTYTDPTFKSMFGVMLADLKKGGVKINRHEANDEDASAKDAESFGETLAGEILASSLSALLTEKGYDPEEVRIGKGWAPFEDMPAKTIEAAIAALNKPARAARAPHTATQAASVADSGQVDAVADDGTTEAPDDMMPGDPRERAGSEE